MPSREAPREENGSCENKCPDTGNVYLGLSTKR